MADVKSAIDAVLHQEDETLSGKIVNVRGDTGGTTRFGLAMKWHPELCGTRYYTTMSNADALQVAVNTLNAQYAESMQIAAIADQALATKFLSYGVNAGNRVAIWTMQRAVNAVLPNISLDVQVDGLCGPSTVAAINRCMPQSLLNAFRLQMIQFYAGLCNQRAADRNELLGWVNRALA